MNQICKIILVRHGESVNNRQKIIAGDSPLTEKGKQQALEAKAALADLEFDEIYSSDLVRAVETAEIIAGRKVPDNHKIPGLRERDFGSLNEKTHEHYDKEHEIRMAMTHKDGWVYKHVPDMENDHELAQRFIKALKNLGESNKDKTILVAAHGGAIRTTLMELMGLTYREIPQGSFINAGFVELDYSDGQFTVVRKVGHQI